MARRSDEEKRRRRKKSAPSRGRRGGASTKAKAKTKRPAKAKTKRSAKAKTKTNRLAKAKAKAKTKRPAKAKAKTKRPAKAKARAKARARAKTKHPANARAKTKHPANAKAKTKRPAKAKAKTKRPAKAKAKTKRPAKARAKTKTRRPAKKRRVPRRLPRSTSSASGVILTHRESLRGKLDELRARYLASGELRGVFDPEVAGRLRRALPPEPYGWAYAVTIGEEVSAQSVEQLIYYAVEGARTIDAAQPGGGIQSAFFFTVYGPQLVGSRKSTLYVDVSGEFAETCIGTRRVPIGLYEQQARDLLEEVAERVEREEAAVVLEEVAYRSYFERE